MAACKSLKAVGVWGLVFWGAEMLMADEILNAWAVLMAARFLTAE